VFTWKKEAKQRMLHSEASLHAMITISILYQVAKLYTAAQKERIFFQIIVTFFIFNIKK